MAKGKNKRQPRKGKNAKRSDKHTFLKKQWFTLISPTALKKSIPVGWTCCKKPTGTEVVSDFLKGRVAEICYADITSEANDVNKKIKIVVDEIHGRICATNFYSFELTKDKIAEKLKKRQSLIDVYCDVKTSDGVISRIFSMLTTNKRPNQVKLNSYAQTSKIKLLRKTLVSDLLTYSSQITGDNLAHEVITGVMDTRLEKLAQKVIPGVKLQIYKMKTVKRGVVDVKQLLKDAQENATNLQVAEESPEAVNLLSKEQP
jgi:small subunit ribosomal protein S3Ae